MNAKNDGNNIEDFADELSMDQLLAVNGGGFFSRNSSSGSSGGSHGGGGSHRGDSSSGSKNSNAGKNSTAAKNSGTYASNTYTYTPYYGMQQSYDSSKRRPSTNSGGTKTNNAPQKSSGGQSSAANKASPSGSAGVKSAGAGTASSPSTPATKSSATQSSGTGTSGNVSKPSTPKAPSSTPSGMSGCPSTYKSSNTTAAASSANKGSSVSRSYAFQRCSGDSYAHSSTGSSGSSRRQDSGTTAAGTTVAQAKSVPVADAQKTVAETATDIQKPQTDAAMPEAQKLPVADTQPSKTNDNAAAPVIAQNTENDLREQIKNQNAMGTAIDDSDMFKVGEDMSESNMASQPSKQPADATQNEFNMADRLNSIAADVQKDKQSPEITFDVDRLSSAQEETINSIINGASSIFGIDKAELREQFQRAKEEKKKFDAENNLYEKSLSQKNTPLDVSQPEVLSIEYVFNEHTNIIDVVDTGMNEGSEKSRKADTIFTGVGTMSDFFKSLENNENFTFANGFYIERPVNIGGYKNFYGQTGNFISSYPLIGLYGKNKAFEIGFSYNGKLLLDYMNDNLDKEGAKINAVLKINF